MNQPFLHIFQTIRKARLTILVFVMGAMLLFLWLFSRPQVNTPTVAHNSGAPGATQFAPPSQTNNLLLPQGTMLSSPRHMLTRPSTAGAAVIPQQVIPQHPTRPKQTHRNAGLRWLWLIGAIFLGALLIRRRGVLQSWLARRPWQRPAPTPMPTRKSPTDTQVLRHAYGELKEAFDKEEERMRQLVHLDALSRRLQRCANTSDLAESVARCAQGIFPGADGALYLHVDDDRFGLTLAWGEATPVQVLKQLDCHALHSGQNHQGQNPGAMACAHVRDEGAYVCLPLLTTSGIIGLLYLARLPQIGPRHMTPWAANAIAERAALGLSALRSQEQWRLRAVRDGLTGLFNRGFMEESLGIEIQRALRQGSSVGIMLIDVDHFKRYNDSHGHAAGDALLRGFGKLLQSAVREGDMACRYGGEEFVLILPGADLARTRQRALTLCKAIAQWQPQSEDADLQRVTASFGVACYPEHGETWQAVMKRADEALYQAKDAGRNQVCAAQAHATQVELI